MIARSAVAMVVLITGAAWQSPEPPGSQPAASQPDTSASSPSGLRRPEQIRILEELLREQETPRTVEPIAPQNPGGPPRPSLAPAALLEGTMLWSRAGRLVQSGGGAELELLSKEAGYPESIRLLPNSLLELMERDSELGVTEFIVSGEVTAHRGTNYLLLRNVTRRVSNSNLAP